MQSITHQAETLLIQAKQAHGQYEQTSLHGIYDQDWTIWYANYAIEQDMEKVLNRSFSRERLSRFLSQSYEQYKAEQSQKTWATYTPQKLVEEWLEDPTTLQMPWLILLGKTDVAAVLNIVPERMQQSP